jgi:hypothetical protein
LFDLEGFVTKRTLENAEQLKLYTFGARAIPAKSGEAYGAPAFRAWVFGNYAYISTGRVERNQGGGYQTNVASIWIVNISDPTDPASYSYIWTPDIATGFFLTDEYAIAIGADLQTAIGYVGLEYWMIVADMRDPEYPVVNRTLELPGQPMGLTAARGVAYVAAGQAGLQILWPEEGKAVRALTRADFEASTSLDVQDVTPAISVATPPPTLWPGTPTPTPDFFYLTMTPPATFDG